MAQQRGHLADRGQPRGGLQALLLLARDLLDAALVAHVEHRAHPAGVETRAVDEWGFEDQHREALAVLAHEDRLEAFARGLQSVFARLLAAEANRLAARVFVGELGRPVQRRRAADHFFGAEADHLAERRIDVGHAALQVARAQTGDERFFHRLAERQRFGERALSGRALAHVAHQQDDDDAERERESEHERDGEVRNQPRAAGDAVHAQLQRLPRQIDQALGDVDAAAAHQPDARQACAVAFDERQLMVAQHLRPDRFGQHRAQREGRGHEAVDLAAALHRHAHVHHLEAEPIGQRNEVAARKNRRRLTARRAARDFGFEVDVFAPDSREHRRLVRRIDRVGNAVLGVAPLDAQQLAVRV